MYRIQGGDFERAGAASGCLKEMLKRVGVEPEALRRAMIAAYEAETNVIIHAHRGEMRVSLEDGLLDVEVIDEGPGIPDIELAMKEGFSTAPPAARELGFGAGMGLPNIKKNADRFQIDSTVGRGTRVRFRICFTPQAAARLGAVRLRVVPQACTGCLKCLRVCPMEALRVRGGQPQVIEALCIGCGACIAACPAGALGVDGTAETLEELRDATLVAPAGLLVQFGARIPPGLVVDALRVLGCGGVWVTAWWEDALRKAVAGYAREAGRRWPVLSPACAAVVNLVETRFPSLIGQLAPFASPVEAALSGVAGRDAAVVVGCPAQCSALAVQHGWPRALLEPRLLVQAISRAAAGGGQGAERAVGGERQQRGETLRVTGFRQVLGVLEKAENGLLADVPVLELWACHEGCFGSPLLREEPAVARWRWERFLASHEPALAEGLGVGGTSVPPASGAQALPRQGSFTPRQGLRLDEDMARAIEKLGQLDRLIRELPGRDCAACGAPSCRALAEDIVLGRGASVQDCRLRVAESGPKCGMPEGRERQEETG